MNTTPTLQDSPAVADRLERPRDGRVLAGVAAGIARRTGSPVGIVRLGFIVSTLFAGLGALVYLAAWALIPDEAAPESAAQRWLAHLAVPGRRISSVLIGLGALLVVAATAPVAAVAAVAVLVGAALLGDRPPEQAVAAGVEPVATESNQEE